MLLKIKISKALPAKSLDYGTSKNILEQEIRRNLFSNDLSPAEEMVRTAHQLGKWYNTNDRKSFSIVISPDPKDDPTEEQLIDVTNAVLDMFFATNQGVIVLHKDKFGTADASKSKPVLHAHFFGSVVDPVTGKNLHLSQKDLYKIRKWAEEYSQKKHGWTPITKSKDLRKSKDYKREVLRTLSLRGSYSWRLKMTEIIEKQYSEASSFNDFLLRLQRNGIDVFSSRRNQKNKEGMRLPELKFSFNFRNKTMVVNASTISNNLTWEKLITRFPDFGGSKDGTGIGRSEKENKQGEWLGKGSYSEPTIRKNSGQGYIGKSGKLDYDCIICSHDKLLCKDCSRDEIRGGTGHERNGRTR